MTRVTIEITDTPTHGVGDCAEPGCTFLAMTSVSAWTRGYQASTVACPFHVREARVKVLRMLADASERELAEETELRSHGVQTMPAPLL